MSDITSVFDRLKRSGDGAFIPYVCAGDPDPDFTLEQVIRLSEAGADIVELGLPFSDPIADGPVIQAAMNRSLEGGFTTQELIDTVGRIREAKMDKPIVVMTYYNPVLQYGPERFCTAMATEGADGLLIVDLPPEESKSIDSQAKANGLDVIRLVTPTTSDARMAKLLANASGFVYAVSAAGTTGAKTSLPTSALPLIRRTRAVTPLPVVLGFGISYPEHVSEAISSGASGVVEGSAIISSYSGLLHDRSLALEAIGGHASKMKNAARGLLSPHASAQS